jgi:hypothetical protein
LQADSTTQSAFRRRLRVGDFGPHRDLGTIGLFLVECGGNRGWHCRASHATSQNKAREAIGGKMRGAVTFVAAIVVVLTSGSAAPAQSKLTLGYGATSARIASFVATDKGKFANDA